MILEQKSSHILMKSDGNTKLESSAKTRGSRKTVHRSDQDSSKDQRWLKGFSYSFQKGRKKPKIKIRSDIFLCPMVVLNKISKEWILNNSQEFYFLLPPQFLLLFGRTINVFICRNCMQASVCTSLRHLPLKRQFDLSSKR